MGTCPFVRALLRHECHEPKREREREKKKKKNLKRCQFHACTERAKTKLTRQFPSKISSSPQTEPNATADPAKQLIGVNMNGHACTQRKHSCHSLAWPSQSVAPKLALISPVFTDTGSVLSQHVSISLPIATSDARFKTAQ